jgi:hypothetical protein
MRLNGVMALIAVVCVVGVVSGELLGPMAQLRHGRSDEDDVGFSKRHAIGAELADDTFLFAPEKSLLFELLGPMLPSSPSRGRRRYYPPPAFSAVGMLFDGDGGDGDDVSLIAFQSPSDGLSNANDLTNADFTPPPQSPTPFQPGSQPPFFFVPPPIDTGKPPPLPPSAAPEPSSWLLLILGLGGAGLALRRWRTREADRRAPMRPRSFAAEGQAEGT